MSNDALTESIVRDALIANKGDMILTHRALFVSLGKLSSYVRGVPNLRRLMMEMDREKADPEYDNMTNEQFASQINSLTKAYELDGLNTIHELATTDHDGNASLADVRLKAAIQLRGKGTSQDSGLGNVLAELNDQYVAMSSRVKNLRMAATLTLSVESRVDDPVVIGR